MCVLCVNPCIIDLTIPFVFVVFLQRRADGGKEVLVQEELRSQVASDSKTRERLTSRPGLKELFAFVLKVGLVIAVCGASNHLVEDADSRVGTNTPSGHGAGSHVFHG